MHGFRPLLGAAVAVALAAHLAAQNAPQTRAGQYTRADIEAGARIYAQCVGCHGVNGDQIANVDLRRGQFPTVVSDADLVRLMATGKPAVGMPPFTVLRTDEVTTLVAYIRSGFDAASGAPQVRCSTRREALTSATGEGGTLAAVFAACGVTAIALD